MGVQTCTCLPRSSWAYAFIALAAMTACGSEGVVEEADDEQHCHARVNVKGVVGLHRSLGDRSNGSRCFVCLVVVGSEGGMVGRRDRKAGA